VIVGAVVVFGGGDDDDDDDDDGAWCLIGRLVAFRLFRAALAASWEPLASPSLAVPCGASE